MSRRNRLASRALALAGLLAASGCAGTTLGDVLGGMGGMGGIGGMGSEVRGEVARVDDRGRRIELRSGWGGSSRVRYDSRTEVIYRDRRYSVRDLERGDLVSIRLEGASRGEPYADRIYVEESVRDRGRGGSPADRAPAPRLELFDGRVRDVDPRRGWFQLDSRRGRYTVTLPYDPPSSLVRRFRRLRRGDAVTIEAARVDRGRVEVYRFR